MGPKGIVLESFGVGNFNDVEAGWVPWIEEQRKRGVEVLLSSQCHAGELHPELYRSGRGALLAGARAGPRYKREKGGGCSSLFFFLVSFLLLFRQRAERLCPGGRRRRRRRQRQRAAAAAGGGDIFRSGPCSQRAAPAPARRGGKTHLPNFSSLSFSLSLFLSNRMAPECAVVKMMLCLKYPDLAIGVPLAGEL